MCLLFFFRRAARKVGAWLCARGHHSPARWVPGNRMECGRCRAIYRDLS